MAALNWTMCGSWGDTWFYAQGRCGMWRMAPRDGGWRLTLAPPGELVGTAPGWFTDREAAQAFAAQEESA